MLTSQYPVSRIPSEATCVLQGIVFDTYHWQQELYDGSFATFEMIKRADAVSIIPIINNELLVLHEEQPTHLPRTSFPGGHIERGEEPLAAAIRELREETGMTFKTLKLVMIEDIGGDRLEWWAWRFIATDLIKTETPKTDAGEKIWCEQVDFSTAQQLASGNVHMNPIVVQMATSVQALLNLPEIN